PLDPWPRRRIRRRYTGHRLDAGHRHGTVECAERKVESMAIEAPAPKQVKAGEPVTAEGWNAIVNAITATIQYLNTSEASSVRVVIKNAGVSTARVTATRDDGVSFEAVAPVPPETQYIFAGLRAGAYKLRVDAPGFSPGLVDIVA